MVTANVQSLTLVTQPDVELMQNVQCSTILPNANVLKDISGTDITAERLERRGTVLEVMTFLSNTVSTLRTVPSRARVMMAPTLARIMLLECAQLAASATLSTVPKTTSAS